jgi:hypothetical protein
MRRPNVRGLHLNLNFVDEAVNMKQLAPVLPIIGIQRTALHKDATLTAIDDFLFDEHQRAISLSEQSAGCENNDDIDLVSFDRLPKCLKTCSPIFSSSRSFVKENMAIGDIDIIQQCPLLAGADLVRGAMLKFGAETGVDRAPFLCAGEATISQSKLWDD